MEPTTSSNATASVALDSAVAARRTQNAKLAISKLPVELLCSAFALLSLAQRIAVSAVCHHWREAAIGCPSLWADLDHTATWFDVDFFIIFLQRSKDAPLDLKLDWDLLFSSDAVALLRTHLHRARSLHLECGAWKLGVLLEGVRPHQLKELNLRALGTSSAGIMHTESDHIMHAVYSGSIDLIKIKSKCPQLTRLTVISATDFKSPPKAAVPQADVYFDHLDLHGSPDWTRYVIAQTRSSRHIFLKVHDLRWDVVQAVPSIGPIEELALVADIDYHPIVTARSGSRTRAFIEFSANYRHTTELPSHILSDPAWMQNLTSLALFDRDWRSLVPVAVPVLEHLTVLMDGVLDPYDELCDGQLFRDANVFAWSCPLLTTVTIGTYLGDIDGKELEPVNLLEDRLLTFLGDILGFDQSRVLKRLNLVNVLLMDEDNVYLDLKRKRGSALRLTDAAKICGAIVASVDRTFHGLPDWWQDPYSTVSDSESLG